MDGRTEQQAAISVDDCDPAASQRVSPSEQATDFVKQTQLDELLPEQVPPTQGAGRSSIVEVGAGMYANVTCWPPLGQTFVVPEGAKEVFFKVLLETNHDTAHDIEVRIWHNHGTPNDWSDTLLTKDAGFNGASFSASHGQYKHTWYSGCLAIVEDSRPTNFTLKFRTATQTGWRWIQDESGIHDGQILFVRPTVSLGLNDLFYGLSGDISISTPASQSPGTKLYSLTFPVQAAHGHQSGFRQLKLGRPADVVRWFATARIWAPWLVPRQGLGERLSLDKDAVMASFLRTDGRHVVVLALSGIQSNNTAIATDHHGSVLIKARNDLDEEGTARVLVAEGTSFESANAVMYEARRVVAGTVEITPSLKEHLDMQAEERKEPKSLWFEEWFDGFTFCTWNALGQDLTEDRITKALKDLKDAGIEIENLLIDDNWQSITSGPSQFERKWTSFEANKEAFPNGLKAAVSKIRSDHPNIKYVAVWHALMGYWGCIAPDGDIGKRYKTTNVNFEMPGIEGERTVVAASDITRMYDDFYRFLSSCGVDGVKTDVQCYLDTLVSASARRELIPAYQDAWTLAQLRHLSARTISCMSQTPSILFHSQLPNNRPTIPVRNSDDFFPDVESSHPWHVFCNAHNALFTQHLNVVPDWDMFQTDHPWGSFHAAARCVSGGPIYFTDTPGKHNIDLINAMTARSPDRGRRIIIRTHTPGKSITAYSGYKEPVLLKIGTYVGYAKTGTAILGVFNCLESAQGELVRLVDFPGAEPDAEYIIRSYHGTVSQPMIPVEKHSLVHVNLEVRGWDILSAHPVRTLGSTKVAVLGLTSHMTGIAAVLGYTAKVEETGRVRLWTNLKAIGTLGVYISDLPSKSVEEHIMVLLGGTPVPAESVSVSSKSPQVLEIDFESIWQKDQAGAQTYTWGNEVSLEVFISP